MNIHIVRHAEAIPETGGVEEHHRYLTPRGRTRFRRVAATLKKQEFEPDVIVTSPRVRAVQTAEILAETFRFNGDLVVSPLLSDGFSREGLMNIVAANPYASEIALVGHEPELGTIIADLMGISERCSLKKGSIVSIRLNPAKPSLKAKILLLVTGGGKAVVTAESAIDRLVVDNSRSKGDLQHDSYR